MLSVGAVLLVLFGVLSWLTRRLQSGSISTARRERVSLTSQHAVHLVELGGVRLLIGTGPSGAPRVLAELEATSAEVVAAEGGQRGGLSWLLGVADGR